MPWKFDIQIGNGPLFNWKHHSKTFYRFVWRFGNFPTSFIKFFHKRKKTIKSVVFFDFIGEFPCISARKITSSAGRLERKRKAHHGPFLWFHHRIGELSLSKPPFLFAPIQPRDWNKAESRAIAPVITPQHFTPEWGKDFCLTFDGCYLLENIRAYSLARAMPHFTIFLFLGGVW